MAKLGWVAFGLLAVLVAGVGASRAITTDDKLDEIRALMAENNRIQRIDVHARLRKGHPLFRSCDLGEKCDLFDSSIQGHDERVKKYIHKFTEDCITAEGCANAEERQKKLVEKK